MNGVQQHIASLIATLVVVFCAATVNAQGFPPATEEVWMEDGWVIPSPWTPVNDTITADDFARKFLTALAAKDVESFNKLTDYKLLSTRATSVCESITWNKSIAGLAKSTWIKINSEIANPNTQYELVRIRRTRLGSGPIFRLVRVDGTVTYHHWYLIQDLAGAVKAVDIYVMENGESIGDQLRRIALLLEPQPKTPSFVEKLPARDQEIFKFKDSLANLMRTADRGDHVSIIRLSKSLPDAIRNSKYAMIQRVTATVNHGRIEGYEEAIADYAKAYPFDAAGPLMAMKAYRRDQKFEELETAAKNAQRIIGPDAHLYLLRGEARMRQNDIDMARRLIKRAHQLDSSYKSIYVARAACEALDGNHADALRLLKYIAKVYGEIELKIDENPDYAAFVSAPEYDDLQEYLKLQKKLGTDFLTGDLE